MGGRCVLFGMPPCQRLGFYKLPLNHSQLEGKRMLFITFANISMGAFFFSPSTFLEDTWTRCQCHIGALVWKHATSTYQTPCLSGLGALLRSHLLVVIGTLCLSWLGALFRILLQDCPAKFAGARAWNVCALFWLQAKVKEATYSLLCLCNPAVRLH